MEGNKTMQIRFKGLRHFHSPLRLFIGITTLFSCGIFSELTAQISVNSNYLDYSANQWADAGSQTFSVSIASNRATAHSFWLLSSNAWLQIAPSNDTSLDIARTITVTYATANLDPGTYTGDIMVVSPLINNSPVTIPVTCTVAAADGTGIRVGPNNTGQLGDTISVPLQLISTGNVNAAGFSICYNKSAFGSPSCVLGSNAADGYILVNSGQASRYGRLGITVNANATNGTTVNTFEAGTQEIAVLSLTIASSIGPGPQPIVFTNTPIFRELADSNGAAISGVLWADGNVFCSSGIEADSAPRYLGNTNITVADWVQIGRFVAGLDTTQTLGEFQRVDCAPYNTFGDGYLSVIDWTQAGRFVAGLDALAAASGPTKAFPNEKTLAIRASGAPLSATKRSVHFADSAIPRGETNNVDIELDSQGNENAVGFTLRYDPALIAYVGASLGTDAQNAIFLPNTTRTAEGLLGFAMALPTGETFKRGTRQILRVSFAVPQNSIVDHLAMEFTDDIVIREICNSSAIGLTSAFNGTNVSVIGVPHAPDGLSAGKNAYIDKVMLSWNSVPGATQGYQIWRSLSADSANADLIARASTASYADISALPGQTYYYWIKAVNLSGASDFSAGDYGIRHFAPPLLHAGSDFDGDGVSDAYTFDSASGAWTLWLSSRQYERLTVILGGPDCFPVPADYDGDKKIDPAVYNTTNGIWRILCSSCQYDEYSYMLGGVGYTPVPADYDGDARSDFAVYHDVFYLWRICFSACNYQEASAVFGAQGCLPAAADFDGDGKADPTVYNGLTAEWQILLSGSDYTGQTNLIGNAGSGGLPVPADYDGDGLADPAVYDAANGSWYFFLSGSKSARADLTLGGTDYTALPADYDGDGRVDPAVYLNSGSIADSGNQATWLMRLSSRNYAVVEY